jgi:hypothetical protein
MIGLHADSRHASNTTMARNRFFTSGGFGLEDARDKWNYCKVTESGGERLEQDKKQGIDRIYRINK